jgi:hypothetical protein
MYARCPAYISGAGQARVVAMHGAVGLTTFGLVLIAAT